MGFKGQEVSVNAHMLGYTLHTAPTLTTMVSYDAEKVKAGDQLVLKADYDRKLGRRTVVVREVFNPSKSQSGIAFDVGLSVCPQWQSRLDAAWFEGFAE